MIRITKSLLRTKNKGTVKRLLPLLLLFFIGFQMSWGQQVIGSFPWNQGGMENQTAGAIGNVSGTGGLDTAKWRTLTANSTTGITSASINEDANGRSGGKYLKVVIAGTSSTAIKLLCPRANNVVTNPKVVGNTAYVVQFYYKPLVAGTIYNINGSICTQGSTTPYFEGGIISTTILPSGWIKAVSLVSAIPASPTFSSNSSMGITFPNNSASNASYDDFVVYAGTTADLTAPDAPTSLLVDSSSGTSNVISWSAPSSGVDGGGYVVVRYAANPNEDNDPNMNGIYSVNSTITNGTGSLVGTVVYTGTGLTFTDTISSPTTYFYKVYSVDKAFNYSTELTVTGGSNASASPTLTADNSLNTVDNTLDITFTDDATWRAAVTTVKIGTTTLTSGTDYDLTAGNLQLKPSGLNSLLTASGSKSVSIIATGYAVALVTQVINAGVPTTNSTVSITPSLAKNTTSTVTCTAKDQYNNLVNGYAFKFNVSRTDTTGIAESYTLNGAVYTSNASGVSTGTTNTSGVIAFAVQLPAIINANDGISFQVTLADGTTNIGAAYSFINSLTPQTIAFAALSPVNYSASGTFTLNGTASSGLSVSYTSSNTAVATVSGSTVTIVGVGTTSITASQAGDSNYDAALSVSHDLVINCGSTSNTTTTISACGSYTWANTGVTYTTSGLKTGTTTNCVTQLLDLTISGSTNITDITVCDPYTWGNNGQTYTVSGIYEGTTTDCVLEKLNLTINAKNSFYVDADGDGYGAGSAVLLCDTTAPSGYSTTNTDCNDAEATVWRTGTFFQDVDGDGYTDKSTSICYGNSTPAGYLAAASSPNKIWDFSNTTTSSGIGATDIVTDKLGLYPLLLSTTTNMGAITGSVVTFAATATTDAFGPTVTRLQLNGGGSTTTSMPSQRYAYFDVDGPSRVMVWFRTGGSGTRTLYVTDGTNLINSLGSTNSAENLILKANYTGGARRLYIYGDQSCNIYKIQVTGANVTTPSIVAAPYLLASAFTADTTLNNVDNNIDITFTDNPTWRAAVNAVKIGATTLVSGTDYELTEGNLRLKPSGGNAALTIIGDKKVNILATGYSSSSTGLTQTITVGAISATTSIATISAALAPNSTRTITCTAKDQFGNNIAGHVFKFLATIANNGASATDSYTIDGIAYTETTSTIAITAVTNSSGVATFNVVIPSVFNSSEGISIQVKLNDGTNLGNAFTFVRTPIVTVVDNCGTSVLTTNSTGTLLWSTGETSPSITVNTAGTYSVTQTLIGTTSASGSGVAAPIFNGISSQPINTPICKVIGGTAVLSVVSVNPNVTYQWQTQAPTGTTWANVANPTTGTAIYTGDTSASLSIRKQTLTLPVSLTKYRVIVTGSCSTETSNVVTITDAVLPTEVVGAFTSTTSTSTGFAAATLAVGPFVGTQTTVSYRVPAFTGSGLTYYWTVPAGVSIVGQPSGVTSVTQEGADANVLNVNFNGVASGIGTIGSITVQAQNASGCKTAAKSVILTKALPAAPTAIKMTDATLPLPISGVATAVTSFAKYMGTTKELTLTATPSATATSYSWELPAGVTQLSGGNSNVITVNFADVTSSNTDSYTTTAGVLTYVTRIGVKSVNGVGSSTTSNSALLSPTTSSVAKLLTLTAVAPAAPTTLVMNNGTTTTSVTIVSKFIGTSTEFTLIAAASALASSYSWELPTGVNVISGSDLTSNSIKVNFANVTQGTNSLYFGVKAVNGIGSSVTNNSATTVNPSTDSTAKLLKVTATIPAAPATLAMNNGITTTAVTIISKFIGTSTEFTLTAANSALANTYSWEIPSGVNVIQGSNLTSNTIKVNFANVAPETTSLYFGVKAVNGVGSSVTNNSALTVIPSTDSTAKLLKVTATAPLAPTTLVLNELTPTTAVTVVSKYIGTVTTLKLTAGSSLLANSYEWTLPTGVNRTDANGVSVDGLTSDVPFIYVNFANVSHGNTSISLVFGVKAVNGFGSSISVNVAPNAANTSKLLTVTASAPVAVAAVSGLLSVCNRSEGYNYTITAPVGANYYVITAPVGSVVSSANGVSGSTPNVMTTTDLTFNVVYSGTTAFLTTDKSLSIKSGNAFGLSTTAKALALVKLATCPTTTGKFEMISSYEFKVVAYPNPYASTFQLNFTTTSESQVEMRVYDMIGKLVEARQFSTTDMNNQEVGTNYPSGIYNVIVTQGENVKTLRVIKR